MRHAPDILRFTMKLWLTGDEQEFVAGVQNFQHTCLNINAARLHWPNQAIMNRNMNAARYFWDFYIQGWCPCISKQRFLLIDLE